MSVFKRGVKLSQGALVDELGTDSDSESGEEVEKEAEESEDSDESGSDDISEDVAVSKKPEAVESESEEEPDPDNVKYPVTCSLCNKVLFNLNAVNEHMASKLHKKKEEEMSKSETAKSPLQDATGVPKKKTRSQIKKERRLEKKRQERASKGHVWGQHVKPDKKPQPAESAKPATKDSSNTNSKDSTTKGSDRRQQPAANSKKRDASSIQASEPKGPGASNKGQRPVKGGHTKQQPSDPAPDAGDGAQKRRKATSNILNRKAGGGEKRPGGGGGGGGGLKASNDVYVD